uniref:Uncharacterized protein n=1 Tax=Oryza brachyantha TaxID=4533 RepID=J3M1X1_ORYBR
MSLSTLLFHRGPTSVARPRRRAGRSASSAGAIPSTLITVATHRCRAQKSESDGPISPLPGDDNTEATGSALAADVDATDSTQDATGSTPSNGEDTATLFQQFVSILTGETSNFSVLVHALLALFVTAAKNPNIQKKVADQIGQRVPLSQSVTSFLLFLITTTSFLYNAIKSGKELQGLGSYLLKICKKKSKENKKSENSRWILYI